MQASEQDNAANTGTRASIEEPMTDRSALVTTIVGAAALIATVLIAGFQHISRDYDRAYNEMVRLYQEAADDRQRRDQGAAQDRDRLEAAANAAHSRIEDRLLRVENILLGRPPDANAKVND